VWSGGTYSDDNQVFTPNTGAQQAGAVVGPAGAVFGAVENAISGFKKGGVSGDAAGIASIAGRAAALDPELISKAVLAGVALVSTIVGQVFGNNNKNVRRTFQITSPEVFTRSRIRKDR
jgi:hypothetical protein